MIQRVPTPEGERWAIVFESEYTSLEEIAEITHGLVGIVATGTASDLWDGNGKDVLNVMMLLQELLPTAEQASNYERHLKSAGKIKKA